MKQQKISVGRASVNDIVISSPEVSKFHCYFEVRSDGTLWVQDLGSSNGVFVNNKRVTGGQAIKKGDVVLLGKTRFFWEEELLASELPKKRQGEGIQNFERESVSSDIQPQGNSKSKAVIWLTVISSVFLLLGVLWSTGVLDSYQEAITEVTGKWALKNDPIVYDIKCLTESSRSNQVIHTVEGIKRNVLGLENVEVTLEEELEVGRQFISQVKDEYSFSKDARYTQRIDKIFKKLLASMVNPRFQYECHVVDSEEINAQTAGGQIVIFTGIIDFAASDDEIACILGHEIFHNELGHLRDSMRELRLTQDWLGTEWGEYAFMASKLVTQSFNQQNEVYSDLHGIDLAVKAGYDGCAGIEFWERMDQQQEDGRRGAWAKFLSTHPFSSERVACNRAHIDTNYYHTCRQVGN
jgi:Zn-dependent protease with chaperone function